MRAATGRSCSARDLGLAVMATPFAESLVGMLESLDIDAFKIASGDLTFDGTCMTSAVAAVAHGACIYERHLVLGGDTEAIDRALVSDYTPSDAALLAAAGPETRRSQDSAA